MIEAKDRRSVFDVDPLSDRAIVGHASTLLYYPSPKDGIVRSIVSDLLARVAGCNMRVNMYSARDADGNMLATEISRIEHPEGSLHMGESSPIKQISLFGFYQKERICIGTTWYLRRVLVFQGESNEFVLIKKRFFHMEGKAITSIPEEDDAPFSLLTRRGIAEAIGMRYW